MAVRKAHAVAFCTAILLGGCSIAEDALFPTLTDPGERVQVHPSAAAAAPLAVSAEFVPSQLPAAPHTGTFVGGKVVGLRNELGQLQHTLARQNADLAGIRNETIMDSQRYHGTVAAINARLQVGTTPGNPILMQQWREAQTELDQVSGNILRMNRLATEVGSTSSMAAYLLNAVQAARGLSGAVEEDHRQLRILEDEVNRTLVSIERLLSELAGDITRQQQYVSNEKSNLNTLAVAIQSGQLYGSNLAVQLAPAPAAMAMVEPPAAGDRPLVVIRFDRPKVQYEPALYSAVRSALERRPTATFDVVAVSPRQGSPGQTALGATSARRNAEAVLRSLTNMGLPPNRVRLSATQAEAVQTGEVHVFVR